MSNLPPAPRGMVWKTYTCGGKAFPAFFKNWVVSMSPETRDRYQRRLKQIDERWVNGCLASRVARPDQSRDAKNYEIARMCRNEFGLVIPEHLK